MTLLLTAASADAMAGWTRVGSNENGSFFADAGTIIRTGNKVKIRTLYDYQMAAKVAGETFVSIEAQEEYDCTDRLSRTLSFTFFSKHSGKGRKVHSDHETHEWEPVKPGSVREALWEFSCKRK